MAKLFLFGIGGTGVRVIKSLTMLLAAGVDVKATEIVPIIVDPHQSNSDLKRTIDFTGKLPSHPSSIAAAEAWVFQDQSHHAAKPGQTLATGWAVLFLFS